MELGASGSAYLHNPRYLPPRRIRTFEARSSLACKKSSGQNSELIPLTDYMPRKGEALERGYVSGRYGGTPTVDVDLFSQVRDATQSDRIRINLNEPHEVRFWAGSFGIDEDGLRRAVKSAGNNAADVRNFLAHRDPRAVPTTPARG